MSIRAGRVCVCGFVSIRVARRMRPVATKFVAPPEKPHAQIDWRWSRSEGPHWEAMCLRQQEKTHLQRNQIESAIERNLNHQHDDDDDDHHHHHHHFCYDQALPLLGLRCPNEQVRVIVEGLLLPKSGGRRLCFKVCGFCARREFRRRAQAAPMIASFSLPQDKLGHTHRGASVRPR